MKYMGSKNRVAKDLVPIIESFRKPNQLYIEPFMGGCNMLDKIKNPRLGADSNEYLVSMFKALQEGWDPPTEITKDDYKIVKDNKSKFQKHFVGWVGFNCSYSGKWFGGYAGTVVTKSGKTRNYIEEAYLNIKKQIPNLKGVSFNNSSYLELEIPDGSLIYCDPPYEQTTGYKDNFNHTIFWDWVRKTSLRNTVLVSEYNAPEDFDVIWEKSVVSSLSANGKSGGSKKSTEKLFQIKNPTF